MKTLCKKANVPYFRFHPIRHAGATSLDHQNIPISSIQKLLGHENRSTTEIYIHSSDSKTIEAIKEFEKINEN